MLKVNNISAGYGDIDVLHGISFELKKGEKLAIIGPNGCGKTTLLRTIANLIPFRGDILIDDVSIKKMKRKDVAKKIALLSQMTQMYFSYSVLDTVMMGRFSYTKNSLLKVFSKEDKDVVEKSLKAVHMFDMKDKDISELSGGQLQRVFLAKVLAQDPDIILLDEPTNHLDLSYQIELIDYLKEWSKKENRSIVAVLHDINHALFFSDKVLVLNNGVTESYGKVKEAISSSLLKKVYEMDVVSYMKRSLREWEALS